MMWIIGVALFALCHPGIGGAARMRAHAGGARDRDEGAPLLRRLRPHAVVDAPAQQARLHRIRRQGGPARRLLRHRRHDRDRRDRARGPAATRCTGRRHGSGSLVLFAGPAMNFVIGSGADLRDGADLGPAESATATCRLRQPKPLVSHLKSARARSDDCTGDRPGGAGRHQARRHHRQGRRHRRHNFDEMVAAVRKLDRPDASSSCERDGKPRSPPSSTSPGLSAGPQERPTLPSPSARSASRAAEPPGRQYAQYNPLTAMPGTVAFTGDLAVELGKSLAKIPTKIGALVHSIGGGERDPETPISVVGASIIGGDAFEHGLFHGVLVLPGPAELRARRDQPDAAAAVRRRPHRRLRCSRRSAI